MQTTMLVPATPVSTTSRLWNDDAGAGSDTGRVNEMTASESLQRNDGE